MEELDQYIESYLRLVGYKQEETKLFVTLLKKGAMTILELSRETGIERTKIYTLVENLLRDGLIDEQLDYKKKYVRACDVSKIELILKDRIDALQSLTTNFTSFISKVNLLGGSVSPTGIKFYRGVDGIKQQLWNGLCAEKVIYSYSYRNFIEIVGYRFFDSWAAEFERRGLVNKEIRSDEYVSSEEEPHAQYRSFVGDELRYLPNKILDIQLAVDIYNDTISLYNWNKGEIFGVEIVNKQFADLQRQIYEQYWTLATPVKPMEDRRLPNGP
jgi:sugar-specific transcriptional regulator TrmB